MVNGVDWRDLFLILEMVENGLYGLFVYLIGMFLLIFLLIGGFRLKNNLFWCDLLKKL